MHRTAAPHGPVDERVDFFSSCSRSTGEPRTVEADKAAALRWFELAELPEPVVPHQRPVLAGLREGTLPPVLTNGLPG